jgi:cytidylate kinase
MDMGRVITIDGPAASGKTSVSRELAKRLGWQWVSTGAFYRGLSYVALQHQTDLSDEHQLSQLAGRRDLWHVEMEDACTRVIYQGRDVTELISHEDVGDVASKISHFPKVRAALLLAQRACSDATEGLVAEGRDCGTVVFPKAEAKVYLTASQENRAERRAKEHNADAQAIVQAQKQRYQQDSTRKAAPLQVPDQALVLDSTDLGFEDVVRKVEKFVRSRLSL